MSSRRSSISMSPSSTAIPMAVEVTLLLAEYSIWGISGRYGA